MFAYCNNNPARHRDVSGFMAQDAIDLNDEDNQTLEPDSGGGFDPYQAILDSTYAAQHGGQSVSFSNFQELKSHTGSPGNGNHWHHIVEQNQTSKSGFSSETVNNTSNIISLDAATHGKVSGFYSSKPDFAGGLTVRNWLAGQTFEFQYQFGIERLAIIMFGGE